MKIYPMLFYGITMEHSDPEVLLNRGIMFGFTYPACILLSVWFAWGLVLVSGKLVHVSSADLGLGRNET